MQKTFKQYSRLALIISAAIAALVLGRLVLVPVVFAVLISLCLIPICNILERKGINRLWSIILVFTASLAVISGMITFISITFSNIFEDMPQIRSKIKDGVTTFTYYLETHLGWSETIIQDKLESNASNIIENLWSFFEKSLTTSLAAIGNTFLTMIYIFLILLYRRGIKSLLLKDLKKKISEKRQKLMQEIQKLTQQYIFGMLLVMLILGCLYALGLWIIGIDYFLFWGFLAACLIIVPYVGTTIGGILPFLYALATTDTLWQPLAIVILYLSIQQIEGNFITPNVIGSKIEVNPMVVIFAMIVGGLIWGVAGLILALPLVGIFRILLMYSEKTEKLGLMMGNNLK